VHRDSARPGRLGALAYTEGSDIYLGPGQAEHLPHEAWHVVQQRQGRVRPTGRAGGRPLNDDGRLEVEADAMGHRAGTQPVGSARGLTPAAPVSEPPVVQRVIAGLEWVRRDDDVLDDWVDAYLADVLHPHAHLYEADIVRYLATVGLPEPWKVAQFKNDTGRHWDLKLLNRTPDGGPIVVQTMADGSCGAYLIHAIVHRDTITADVAKYRAPDEYVLKVRRAIQDLIRDDRREIKGRIRDEIANRPNVVETGFGPVLQQLLTNAAEATTRKTSPTAGPGESPRPVTRPVSTERPQKVLDTAEFRTPKSGGRPEPLLDAKPDSGSAIPPTSAAPDRPGAKAGAAPVIDNAKSLRDLMVARTATASSDDSDIAELEVDIANINTDVDAVNAKLATLELIWLDKGSRSPDSKDALTQALKAVQALDQLVYTKIEYWSTWVATHPWAPSALGYLKQLSRMVIKAAQLVNQRFDDVHRRARIGAGGAPELIKEAALVKAARHEAKVGKHAPPLRQAFAESIELQGKKTAETLTMARAVHSGTFKDMRFLPKTEAPQDIDFTSTTQVQGYNNWDQKSMYVDDAQWSGRIPHTHAKTHRGQRTGILLDTTYATEKDYARAWMELNRMTVEATALEDGTEIIVDPKAYLEVRAADPNVYEREIAFDAARGGASDAVGKNLFLFRSKIGAEAFAAQRFKDVFGLEGQIDQLIARSIVRGYSDHRNVLPAGNYMEFDQGIDLGMQAIHYASVRVVREHDTGRLYLTLSHYKPFTWYDEKGDMHQGRPFFEVITAGSSSGPPVEAKDSGSATSRREGKAGRPAVSGAKPVVNRPSASSGPHAPKAADKPAPNSAGNAKGKGKKPAEKTDRSKK